MDAVASPGSETEAMRSTPANEHLMYATSFLRIFLRYWLQFALTALARRVRSDRVRPPAERDFPHWAGYTQCRAAIARNSWTALSYVFSEGLTADAQPCMSLMHSRAAPTQEAKFEVPSRNTYKRPRRVSTEANLVCQKLDNNTSGVWVN